MKSGSLWVCGSWAGNSTQNGMDAAAQSARACRNAVRAVSSRSRLSLRPLLYQAVRAAQKHAIRGVVSKGYGKGQQRVLRGNDQSESQKGQSHEQLAAPKHPHPAAGVTQQQLE